MLAAQKHQRAGAVRCFVIFSFNTATTASYGQGSTTRALCQASAPTLALMLCSSRRNEDMLSRKRIMLRVISEGTVVAA